MKTDNYIHPNEEIFFYISDLRSQFLAASTGITYPNPNYSITRQNSNLFSIEYVYEGEGVINHNKTSYKVQAGDFFILHQNAYHHYYSNPKNPWKKIFLTLNGDPTFLNTLLKLYKIENVCYLPKTNSPFQLENIFNLIKSKDTDIGRKLEILVFKLVTQISDFYHSNDLTLSNKIITAKNLIERRVSTKLSVDEVADFVNLDRSYLSRQFTKQIGVSPTEYITLSKIERATNLLQSSDMSIELIAKTLAFTDKSYFSRRFQQYTGFSPGEFRTKFKTSYEEKTQ